MVWEFKKSKQNIKNNERTLHEELSDELDDDDEAHRLTRRRRRLWQWRWGLARVQSDHPTSELIKTRSDSVSFRLGGQAAAPTKPSAPSARSSNAIDDAENLRLPTRRSATTPLRVRHLVSHSQQQAEAWCKREGAIELQRPSRIHQSGAINEKTIHDLAFVSRR